MSFADALVALTSEALVALDRDTRVLSWNRGATLVFGWDEGEVLGKEAGELVFAPGREGALRDLVAEASATGSAAFEGVARTKSGDEIHMEAVVRLVPPSADGPAWVALTARDTTERTLLLREVFDQNLKLERTLAGLRSAEQSLTRAERFALAGQLAASVCHNLRNPLGAIKNGLYYVRRRLEASSDERLAEQLALMDGEIAASARLVADLLERVHEPPLEIAPASVRDLVDAALARVIGFDWVVVTNEVSESTPPANVDAALLGQCVTNVVQNAVESFGAFEPGGRACSVAVSTECAGERLDLRVTDDGAGIDPALLPRVTAPLFTTKAGRPGAGLAIVEHIVGRHGGKLSIRPRDGGGTIVTISIPEAFPR
ncbi:MAG: ATP-binding protein [Polyangiaceae bacterium]